MTKDKVFQHISIAAEHAKGFSPFKVGDRVAIGKFLNPYYRNCMISATTPAEGIISEQDIRSSYISMLRESVFENVRLIHFPKLPSRTTGIWLCQTDKDVDYWLKRIPQKGEARVLTMRMSQGTVHRAFEEHLTTEPENIFLLQKRAESYWKGEGSGTSEILAKGNFEVLKEEFIKRT